MQIASILVFALIMAGPALGVDTKAFFESIAGEYRLINAGGKPVKPENDFAEVAADPEEGFMGMPYCDAGGTCDPGLNFFPYKVTTVEIIWEDDDSDDYSAEITVRDGKVSRYIWEYLNGESTFINYQYQHANSTVSPLAHRMTKR